MNNQDEEQNSIIHKIDLFNKYPKIIELCFEEFRSKGNGVMMCIIGILEDTDEPRLNCYYVPEKQVDINILNKIKNESNNAEDNLIFYISDTKYNKVTTIKIGDLNKYLS